MIRRILIVTAIILVIGLIVLWFVAGGAGKVASVARNFNPLAGLFGNSSSTNSTSSSSFRLPWQPDFSSMSPTMASDTESKPQQQTQSTQSNTYDAPANDAKTFGNPSPHRGEVTIRDDIGARNSGPDEYIEIDSAYAATAPVDVTGWSFESVVTGVRAFIPKGASKFLMGSLNVQNDILLNPGVSAIVSTGFSPVGTSFRENICSGYLAQFQQFSPGLWSSCPSPSDAIAINADNIRTFGDSCLDFLRSLQSCETPRIAPTTVTPACMAYAQTNFSYNGCAAVHQSDPAYQLNTWRVYLGSAADLWRNTHDVIRLLDAQGRTVDSITY